MITDTHAPKRSGTFQQQSNVDFQVDFIFSCSMKDLIEYLDASTYSIRQ